MLSATRFNQHEVRVHNRLQHARWDTGRLPRFARHRATGLRPQPYGIRGAVSHIAAMIALPILAVTAVYWVGEALWLVLQ